MSYIQASASANWRGRMINAGADAVVSRPPHVTQGVDVLRGRPIIWNLGNFVFDGFSSRELTIG